MPQSARAKINEQDFSQDVAQVAKDISYAILDAEWGTIGVSDQLITSLTQFEQLYGKVRTDGSNKASYLKASRALQRGSALRVCNQKHYTDPTDAATLDAVLAVAATNNKIWSFSTALIAANVLTLTFTPSGGDPYVVTQVYTTSSANTMALFVAKILADATLQALVGGILIARVIGTTILITPRSSTAASVVTVTAGASQPVVTGTTQAYFYNSVGDALFGFTPKNKGLKYNDLFIEELPATNGNAAYFNIQVTLLSSTAKVELYENLTAANFSVKTFLSDISELSNLVTPVYPTTVLVGTTNPLYSAMRFKDGTDGSAIVAADIIGSATSKVGIYGADGFDDIFRMACFIELGDMSGVYTAGAAYVENRKDLSYFAEVAGTTVSTVVTNKNAYAINSSYMRWYAPGLGIYIVNPLTSEREYVKCIGDVIGIAAKSAEDFGPWFSYANSARGKVQNAIGIGNGWGVNEADLTLLAANQINAVVKKDNTFMIWGNFTGQTSLTLLSYASIRDLVIYLRKSLLPTMRTFLEEPNDIQTWKTIYAAVLPFLSDLRDNKRALTSFDWKGDQFANTMDDLVINNLPDVTSGKYKVKLTIVPINSLQQFDIDLDLNRGTASVTATSL